MNDYPDTIKHPENFKNSQWSITCPYCDKTIGFDGVFDWSWTQGCFGDTKIAPMDFDGVVERHHHFLVFETKDEDIPVPKGQLITLDALKTPKTFTVAKIWGKNKPVKMEIIYGWKTEYEIYIVSSVNEMRKHIKYWYNLVDKK